MADSYFPGTDVLVSQVPVLNRLRLEARVRTLTERRDSHGLDGRGETLLAACAAALSRFPSPEQTRLHDLRTALLAGYSLEEAGRRIPSLCGHNVSALYTQLCKANRG